MTADEVRSALIGENVRLLKGLGSSTRRTMEIRGRAEPIEVVVFQR